jgi:hypothetical protein
VSDEIADDREGASGKSVALGLMQTAISIEAYDEDYLQHLRRLIDLRTEALA